MNRKEKRANKKKNKDSKKRQATSGDLPALDWIEDVDITQIGEDHYALEFNEKYYRKMVLHFDYEAYFWMVAVDRIIEIHNANDSTDGLEVRVEKRLKDGISYPFVENFNPQNLVDEPLHGELIEKWIFFAMAVHFSCMVYCFENRIEHHYDEAIKNFEHIKKYLNWK